MSNKTDLDKSTPRIYIVNLLRDYTYQQTNYKIKDMNKFKIRSRK